EAEGSGGAHRAILFARAESGFHVRTGAVPTATALAGQYRAAANVRAAAAASPAAHDRISRTELVLRRSVRVARTVSRGAVPARHAGFCLRTAVDWTICVCALSRRRALQRPVRRRRAGTLGGVAGAEDSQRHPRVCVLQ